MNYNREKIKDITIKMLLTIPALIVGMFTAVVFILNPLIQLWSQKTDFEEAIEEALKK